MAINKAITLYQPWAYAAVAGWKEWETRSFKTKFRGELFIHSSINQSYLHMLKHEPFSRYFTENISLYFGHIIGKVTVTDCITTEAWHDLTIKEKWPMSKILDERGFGNYDQGRYAWKLENPIIFQKPIPAKGALSLWNFRQCRQCGCSEYDACIKGSETCSWAENDLCSFCKDNVKGSRRNEIII